MILNFILKKTTSMQKILDNVFYVLLKINIITNCYVFINIIINLVIKYNFLYHIRLKLKKKIF